jgi:hypothetical protein
MGTGPRPGPVATDEEFSEWIDRYLLDECLVYDTWCSRWGKKINTHKALSFFVHTEKALFDMLELREEKRKTREKKQLLESGNVVFTEEELQKEKSRIREEERRMEEEKERTKELAKKISNRIRKMSENDMVDVYRESLNRLNLPFFKEYDDDIACFVKNVCNLVKYERIEPSGPKRGPITTKSPLIYPYFYPIKAIGFESTDYLTLLHSMSLDRPHVYGQEGITGISPSPTPSTTPVNVENDFLGLPAVSNGL